MTPMPYRRDHLEVEPPLLAPDYASTRLRAPTRPALSFPHTLTEVTGPLLGDLRMGPTDHDLTVQHDGQPIGQRIIVWGYVIDGNGHPVTDALIELWQANASGRYAHELDRSSGIIDPNFSGVGRTVTDRAGRYEFVTIRPGAYPWLNHHNAWRPAHIHFSLFGQAFTQRLVTQMYFDGDPLLDHDPIYLSAPTETARRRLVATFDLDHSTPEWALAYRYDIVLRGRDATPFETGGRP